MVVSTVVGPGRRFTYMVASHVLARKWTAEQKALHRQVKRELYCGDPEMAFFRVRGVTVVFSVVDEVGTPIDEAVTAPGDCKQ